MTITFQLAVFALIATSSILLISVSVTSQIMYFLFFVLMNNLCNL